jgi:energy-coupling factor transporter ATP-binding protein EcfA2
MLTVEDVTYRYSQASAPALRGISLTIRAGELVVVAGLSGSGKSTFLRLANGLVPHFHGGEFGGRVVVGGMDTREHGPAELSAVCGSLFQDPETQTVMGTVRGEIAFPLENRGASATIVARETQEVAMALEIAHLLDRATHELSGGELQRVALAAALAGRPPLLVLDEPGSQLDPVAGDELIGVVRRLNEQWGTTVLVSEHRLERVLPSADRVIVLAGGEVACDAEPRAFLEWAEREHPALTTPAARLLRRAGLRPPPLGVKEARATLAAHGLLPEAAAVHAQKVPGTVRASGAPSAAGRHAQRPGTFRARRHHAPSPDAFRARCRRVWHELDGGRAILRDVSLELGAGERVALMGRNGAGKSTLLRHLKGLMEPTRGKVEVDGEVALLLQNPNNYLVHETVAEEAPAAALERAGLSALADRHPRDLSGGERQRLALAVVTGTEAPPALLCLDEPTRGMDSAHRGALVSQLLGLAAQGTAIFVATHDTELAAAVAERVVLMGDGTIVADGAAEEILAGGWYFSTETARILGGAGGALEPAAGAELLRRKMTVEVAP